MLNKYLSFYSCQEVFYKKILFFTIKWAVYPGVSGDDMYLNLFKTHFYKIKLDINIFSELFKTKDVNDIKYTHNKIKACITHKYHTNYKLESLLITIVMIR